MLTPETICNVTNRSGGIVAYRIPERNLRREFNVGETKRIPYSEILEVAAQPGGRALLYNYLYIREDEVMKEGLNIKPEPEYYISEDQVDSWLLTSSIDEFKDALDFAPTGVVNLIKQHAVTLPLNDLRKCEALKQITGFNVLSAIANEKATTEEDEPAAATKERRVKQETAVTAAAEIGRRATPKYKVVGRDT